MELPMIIFGASLSPFVRKVLAFAHEKGIDFEHRPFHPIKPPADFLAASPFRKIPALQDEDFSICDSSAIVAYIEAKYPTPPLIPTEPRARARTIWLEEYADTILTGAVAKIFAHRVVRPLFMKQAGDAAVADAAEREELPPVLAYLESIVRSGSRKSLRQRAAPRT
jgi:glutathione S-transferase